MKIKNIIILIILLSQIIFANTNVFTTSPYIKKGFSIKTAYDFNNTHLDYYSYFEYNDKERIKHSYPDMIFNIGINNKFEITFTTFPFIFDPVFLMSFSGRFNYLLLEKNENNKLFNNFAISSFLGLYVGKITGCLTISKTNIYGGFSFGTKQILNKNTIELFISPTYSYSNNIPFHEINVKYFEEYEHKKLKTSEVNIPIAFKTIFNNQSKLKFSLTAGASFSVLLNENNFEKLEDYSFINEVNYKPFTFFAEIGFHFDGLKGNKQNKQQQKENYLQELKLELLKELQNQQNLEKNKNLEN